MRRMQSKMRKMRSKMQRHIPQGNPNLCKHTPPRRYRLLKHITLIVSTNEIARRVLATEPKRSITRC